MINATRYQSLGEILGDALVQFKSDVALIERNRKQETARFTYLQVRREMLRLARGLAYHGVGAGSRVAMLMTNQSKWLISAVAIFHRGAVLVPIDYKLTAAEQVELLRHSQAVLLITEDALASRLPADLPLSKIVAEAPAAKDLGPRGFHWESFGLDESTGEVCEPRLVPRCRDDEATVVYSSGTGGRIKGCVLTHNNYLEQYQSLTDLYAIQQGDRYFSVLPTNHAIDFMCGFIGPFCGGATVVHQRTLRPEFLLDTMRETRITHMAVVPMLLTAFERAIVERINALPAHKKRLFDWLVTTNAALTRRAPHPALSRRLLAPIHQAFGGSLRLLFCGGAFVDAARADFFYRLGIPVVIGYGLTEACTVVTVNDLQPFRGDSVGRPLAGVELRIDQPDHHGVGEVVVRSAAVMSHYLDDPEQTAQVLRDGWLHTGDLGYVDAAHHLHLVGRAKNMIVTPGGKNIYPEDIESTFEAVPCDELAVFSSSYLWPQSSLADEMLLAVVRCQQTNETLTTLRQHNRNLPDFKRVAGVVVWNEMFPRTASMKIKRGELAQQIRVGRSPADVQSLLG